MIAQEEIPERFWGLFRSVNREVYVEALLKINEEYEYNNYFLSREACIWVLNDHFAQKAVWIRPETEEEEIEEDIQDESTGVQILNWLLRAGWLKRLDDYATLSTNIIIPDYAAIFIDAFARLQDDSEDATEIYIQNIYAILFSVKNDKRANVNMLKTALVNTKKLNHVLQDMLHNMDKFFGSLLEKKEYAELLREHLDGYVEAIVRKKYHILKTSDNFYQYKNDIKRWLTQMEEDQNWLDQMSYASNGEYTQEQIVGMLLDIERGFVDIEHRITNMDREHTRYIKATVTRLNYLLNGEDSMRGMILQVLSKISMEEDSDASLERISNMLNLSYVGNLTEQSLYKRRRAKTNFAGSIQENDEGRELSVEEILKMNRIHSKYNGRQIEEFLESHRCGEEIVIDAKDIQNGEDYEKLILAYNEALKKKSPYELAGEEQDLTQFEQIDNGTYVYPKLRFRKRETT